jgi:CubicO group peptidase (beta-lactamase class C family)
MKRLLFGAALLGAAVLVAPAWADMRTPIAAAPAEQVGMSKQRLDRIQDVFKKEADENRLPGAVVLVARKGKLVHASAVGFQDKDAGKPMALDSVFRIYSMTKPIVSVGMMILVEDGKVQLTDPVSKFIPAFKNQRVSTAKADAEYARVTYGTVPADREMTVQDLLRHTAGLAYGEITVNAPVKDAYTKAGLYSPTVRDYDSRALTPAEFNERLAAAPLAHQPGTYWEYSLASDLLGRVIEAASGQRLAAFLDERIFKPLGMSDTAFVLPADKGNRLAIPFATDPASGLPNKLIDVSAVPGNDSGGAGAVSTAPDYLRFTQMLLNGGQLDGVRILSRPTIQLMASDHLGTRIQAPTTPGELLLGTPGYTFGLGFAVRQGAGVAGVHGSQGEFMWAGYAGTYFWVDPKEEVTAVLMTQAPSPARAFYRRLLKQLVYQAIND